MERKTNKISKTVAIIALLVACVFVTIKVGQTRRECDRLSRLEQIEYQMTHHGTLCNIQHQWEQVNNIKE